MILAKIYKYRIFYLFLAPTLLYLSVFTFYPLILGGIMSLQDFGLLGALGWVGTDNYKTIINDPFFWQTIRNTFSIAFGIVIISVFSPIPFAVLLNSLKFKKTKRLFQTSFYIPYLFSWVIISGIFLNLFSNTGFINSLLMKFNLIEHSIGFYTSEKYIRSLIVGATVWKDFGYFVLIFVAALSTIDPSIFDAARVDGVSWLQNFLYIIFPSLIPTVKVVVLVTLMGAMRTFDQSFLFTNPSVYRKSTTSIVYTYERGILQFDLGTSTAAALIIFLIIILVVLIVKKIIRY